MATSSLSNDKRNFQCVAVASVDLIKQPLRDILACHIKPADLFQKIKSCSTLNLRKEQKTICQIPPPARPDYNSFDVTLLYTLIRNLCSLPSPAQGWGHEPTGSDTQLSDDIERLRLFRNSYYAHANSAEISDSSFKDIWRNLRSAISRIQSRYNVDYEDELIRIEQSKYTLSHWEECMTLLKNVAIKQNPSDSGDEPYIIIKGKNEIICGGTARFEADVKNVESSCWSITWQKRRGDDIKCIDTNLGRYNSSTKKTLVIKSVCKEDEGDYQAFLSLDSNGPDYKSRNKIRLYAIGEVPFLNISGVITRREGIAIHYNCGVPDQSPKVHHIEWSKNGQPLDINNKKYVGGGVHDSFLTITSPTYEDRGNYFCKVTNAVGTVQRNEMLDVPKVKISEDSTVCFGSKTTIKCHISSTPTPDKIEWQNSEDGINFHCIGIANSTEKNPLSLCPLLKIDRAAFDDKLYYRLLVWNGIGEAVSNTVDLKVPGSPPNLTTSFVTDIENRSVKLIGNVYVYDDSPGILQTFWTKNDKSINTRESKGKLSETRTDNLSLTITNVGPDDAGEYKLTAINAVGSTTSDAIVLGVPCVFLDRVDDEKNVRRITLTIKSLPAPNKIQWNAKNKDDDTFTPININSKEYKGTTVSFPHPLLVVRQSDQLEKTSYKIEVINFIGKTVQSIPGNIKSAVSKKDIVQNTFYKDRGARVRFTKLCNVLAKDFPTQKIEKLKYTLKNLNIVQNLKSVMEATSALECIRILQDEELFTQTDVIVMQFLCSQTECLDLYAKCFEYAEQQKALCYFEKPPVNGYKNVQFHIKGELSGHDKDYIQNVIETVAAILDCKGDDILLNGVQHSNSFLLSLSVKTVYIRKLLAMNEQDRLRLIRLNIDYILIDKETINLERPRVSQDPQISNSDTFNRFFLKAQQETQKEASEATSLDVYLMNGHKITIKIKSTDQTEDVLEAVASQIELPDEFVYYFGLFLVQKEDGGDISIVRKLQEFESPYISLKYASNVGTHRIVLRKSIWDLTYEDDLLDNKIAMNLLYVQAVSDIERQWTLGTKEQLRHLATLEQRGSKREYLRLARTMKYYGYIQFKPCVTDYPNPHSRVFVAAGQRELNFRIQTDSSTMKEGSFKITRIRCWRITTSMSESKGEIGIGGQLSKAKMGLSFEYLMAKDTLKWITITTDQAFLMNMCLQSMVDELIMKTQGKTIKKPQR